MTKTGLVGSGFMAVVHIKGYLQLENVVIAALCNPTRRCLDGGLSDVVAMWMIRIQSG
ncbi:MAG: hypothetical protein M2R45_00927 [Verrucomicrobia subdivision 3 bacterium]|nr:hypothetical protein [Limisphaerales bacterium]MCS1414596.1 hypothetical protein [Limisphaerales bacterium]